MDAFDAFLRLHHAAGNAAWLRDALHPTEPLARGAREVSAGPVRAAWRPEALLDAPPADWLALGAPIGARDEALGADAANHARSIRRWLDADPAHTVLGWFDADYPSLLREVANPPTALFVHGHTERLWWPQVAVVGSRAPTPAGRERAARWARAFADAGFVVTSGLAAGIDAAAHAATLGEPGTVAVTGTGPDRCFPAAHRRLHADIAHHGCVVTEHPPGTEARPEHFPSRNRIIAGLSLATVVVEAAQRSGALITARLAAETGREVFALPGAPENLKARGCHRLIRDGATLADDPGQVIDALAAGTGDAIGRLRAALRDPPRAPRPGNGEVARRTGTEDSAIGGDLLDLASSRDDAGRVWQALGQEGARFDE
ncbi:MAG: DNA-processing protein DprA, partial [Silanimonas sp.]